uniref:AlkB homolog 2, alpha-ketoglutarate dependent dioxygenase n=2 Tax=Cyprinus carpio TaxID=7962 RepID=A0A9J7XI83_CYPCA
MYGKQRNRSRNTKRSVRWKSSFQSPSRGRRLRRRDWTVSTVRYLTDEADHLFNQLEEEEVEYFSAKLQVYGKSYNVPRKQATYSDEGLMYSFSGVHLLAKPWTPTLEHIRDAVTKATGHTFNFVLINRYKEGAAHDFIFRHDARTGFSKRQIEPVKLELAHGSLLLMNYPTNTYYNHSLPVRKKVKIPCINLTFRRIVKNKQKTGIKIE